MSETNIDKVTKKSRHRRVQVKLNVIKQGKNMFP